MGRKLGLFAIMMVRAVSIAGGMLFVLSYNTSESYLVLEGDREVTVGLHGVYRDSCAQ